MFYDLNGEDENKMETVIIDGMVYRIGEFTPNLKNEVKNLISKIDEKTDKKQQREPIVLRILEEWNDIKKITIQNESDLVSFINFIKFRIKGEI